LNLHCRFLATEKPGDEVFSTSSEKLDGKAREKPRMVFSPLVPEPENESETDFPRDLLATICLKSTNSWTQKTVAKSLLHS
jgi:hypothetical protein